MSPTALRTASIGVLPPLEPLLEPLELGDFDFEPDDFELDDFGFALFVALLAALTVDFGFAELDFALDFGFEALGLAFDFDCDFGLDLLEPALFEAGCFLDFVSAIFLSPRGVPY
jgi:hypothetical protein